MQIREVDKSDIPELSKLAERTFSDAFSHSMPKHDLETILRETRSESYFKEIMEKDTILIAEDEGKIVGYVQFGHVRISGIRAGPTDSQIERIYVDTHLQRKGIGSGLMTAALNHPRIKDSKHIYLSVWDQNQKALGLYQKFGFQKCGEHEVIAGDRVIGIDLIMVRIPKSS